MTYTEVASIHEIPEGRSKLFNIDGKPIAVFNIKGRYHAVLNVCPHRGGPLCEGDLDESVISCPWHGFQFDVVSGTCMMDPMTRATTFEVKVEGDKIFIKA